MSALRVVTHNIHSAGRGQWRMLLSLHRLLRRTHKPHVLATQESKRLHDSLRGYYRHQAVSKRRESGNCLLFTRNDGRIVDQGALEIDGPRWKGTEHDVLHEPRVFPWRATKWHGQPVTAVMCIHRTPGGHDAHEETKRASWAAEDAQIEAWVTTMKALHSDWVILLVGDHNDTSKPHGPLTLRSLASRVDGVLRLEHIDGVIAVDAFADTHRLNRKFGSDHRPVVINITKETL